MTFEQFDVICNNRIAEVLKMRDTKGKEYAGTQDRFANFKRSAARTDMPVLKAWFVFFDKHIQAIESYIREGKTHSTESIQGRITDAICYLLLLEGMIAEIEQKEAEKSS